MVVDMNHRTDEQILSRRQHLLGPAYRLFYDRPLHLVRGDGVWLYDADGRAYLDVYNNVAHVGHCHPHVVEAIHRQAATLNTHTRYLHETVLDYAERLTSQLPDELSVCMFACSGSEANELALRIARTCTEGEGVIVTEHAYHGNTTALAQVSTTHKYVQRDATISTCPAPNTYRFPFAASGGDLGKRYAATVGNSLEAFRAAGVRPAAFLVDTLFATDGILTAPPGYFTDAVARVREVGGLFIADEVQPGFGRTGEGMWGFEQHGVVPDIVTMGKPMGNGHPLAAVVARRPLVERFAETARYFNTFGGNPVSCAAGMAVLDVLERERLQQNARDVGALLKAELVKLQARHEIVGDVRGQGLFLGMELVRDRESLEPASLEAQQLVNDLRDRGVLTGLTGRYDNVLKIRPAMVFSPDNARQLIDALEAALEAI